MIQTIIDEAYKLYMPQILTEITSLAEFVNKQIPSKADQPYTIVEIGTKYGGTFHIWNSLCTEPNHICISIDMSDGGLHGGVSDEDMDKRDAMFKSKFDNCHFIRGNSHDQSSFTKLMELLNGREIDFLFIDGDHTYEGVKQDLVMYGQLVKRGGYIALHDIVDSQRHRNRNVYVNLLWEEVCLNRLSQYKSVDNFCDWQDWGGIGVLIKC